MSRLTLVPALALFAVVGLVGCKDASPKGAAEALGLEKDKPAAQSAAPAAAEAPKPVPAQLPAVVARVNGHDITKAEFDRALKTIEQRAGGPVPADRRDQVYRNLLEQLVRLDLLRQEVAARKVTVTDADLDNRMKEVMAQFPSE